MPPVDPLPPIAVNVFTRAPEPGRVKTRLIPAIGARRAADLLLGMTRVTLTRVREADIGPATLWCTPAPNDTLRALAEEFGMSIRTQRGEDLGERMHYALRSALVEHAGALVLGTDCPFISREDLEGARTLLFEHDHQVVLGPAFDGGYYLLAARRVDATIFVGVPWGSGEVLNRTRQRLDAKGWRWGELATRYDIDRPEDLPLLRDVSELAHFSACGPVEPVPGAGFRLPGQEHPSTIGKSKKSTIKQHGKKNI